MTQENKDIMPWPYAEGFNVTTGEHEFRYAITESEARQLWADKQRLAAIESKLSQYEEAARLLLDWDTQIIHDTLYKATEDIEKAFYILRELVK